MKAKRLVACMMALLMIAGVFSACAKKAETVKVTIIDGNMSIVTNGAEDATVDALLPVLSGSATSGKSAAVSFSAGPAFDLGGVSVKTVSASVAPAAFVLIVR